MASWIVYFEVCGFNPSFLPLLPPWELCLVDESKNEPFISSRSHCCPSLFWQSPSLDCRCPRVPSTVKRVLKSLGTKGSGIAMIRPFSCSNTRSSIARLWALESSSILIFYCQDLRPRIIINIDLLLPGYEPSNHHQYWSFIARIWALESSSILIFYCQDLRLESSSILISHCQDLYI